VLPRARLICYSASMAERRPLIAANWKMHPIPDGALDVDSAYRTRSDIDVLVFPTALELHQCIDAKLMVGAQYGHWEPSGAHTGDISMPMLAQIGCRSVLCGHSERRQGHGETNAIVIQQVIAALEAGLHPILCIGETQKEREAGKAQTVVQEQIAGAPLEQELTIAYEPVWAIGSGKSATPADAQQMHAYIRSLLPVHVREQIRILYGGSVQPANASSLLEQPDIDGALVGGAALDPAQFQAIVYAAVSPPSPHD